MTKIDRIMAAGVTTALAVLFGVLLFFLGLLVVISPLALLAVFVFCLLWAGTYLLYFREREGR